MQQPRVAEQKPLFSCVADSIVSTANQYLIGGGEDEEGNVHGVDASSLLAMPSSRIGRNTGRNSNEDDDEDHGYQAYDK